MLMLSGVSWLSATGVSVCTSAALYLLLRPHTDRLRDGLLGALFVLLGVRVAQLGFPLHAWCPHAALTYLASGTTLLTGPLLGAVILRTRQPQWQPGLRHLLHLLPATGVWLLPLVLPDYCPRWLPWQLAYGAVLLLHGSYYLVCWPRLEQGPVPNWLWPLLGGLTVLWAVFLLESWGWRHPWLGPGSLALLLLMLLCVVPGVRAGGAES